MPAARTPTLRAALTVVVLASSALLVSGCSQRPASETLPDCDDVWVAGNELPTDYEGCMSDGSIQVSETKKCSATEGRFVTYSDTHFAITGQEVSDAGLSSTEYAEAANACFPGGW